MLFRYFTALMAFALALAACSDRKADNAGEADQPTPATHAVELLDADSKPVATLTWVGDPPTRCAITYSDTGDFTDIETDGARRVLEGIGGHSRAIVEREPNGVQLSAGGEHLARIVTEAGPPQRVSALDARGIALFRLRAGDPRRATVFDEASQPVLTVSAKGQRLVTKQRDDTITAFVRGTDDAMLAGLLTAPALELAPRLLLACNHLLGSTHDS